MRLVSLMLIGFLDEFGFMDVCLQVLGLAGSRRAGTLTGCGAFKLLGGTVEREQQLVDSQGVCQTTGNSGVDDRDLSSQLLDLVAVLEPGILTLSLPPGLAIFTVRLPPGLAIFTVGLTPGLAILTRPGLPPQESVRTSSSALWRSRSSISAVSDSVCSPADAATSVGISDSAAFIATLSLSAST